MARLTLAVWYEVVRDDGTVLTVDGRPGRFSQIEAAWLACLVGATYREV